MGARLNARLETLDIDDVFFETTPQTPFLHLYQISAYIG